ncbi:MAG: SUMF1/EgtB/PvdO family nonheme iron enzyme [Granulosicoccus sp.]
MNSKGLPPGYQIHNYRIEQILGEGGFGLTYKAVDLNLNRQVAIKEYMPAGIAIRSSSGDVEPLNAECEERYEDGLMSYVREAQALAQFEHHNIVKVYTFLRHHKTAYIIMEYVDGMTFSEWLRQNPRPTEAELIAIVSPILSGLHELHKVDLLHRDIKPSNIYICLNNRPILLDFGTVGNSMASDETKDQSLIQLTEGYAPPEQYGKSGQGPWTDIYAVGACLYLAATGQMVTNAIERTKQVSSGHIDPQPGMRNVSLRNNYSDHFLNAIEQAISLNPTDRVEDALSLKNRLENVNAAYVPDWVGKPPGTGGSPDTVNLAASGVGKPDQNLIETRVVSYEPDSALEVATVARISSASDAQSTPSTANPSHASHPVHTAAHPGKSRKVVGIAAICLAVAGVAAYLFVSDRNAEDELNELKPQITALMGSISAKLDVLNLLGVQDTAVPDLAEFAEDPIDVESARLQLNGLSSLLDQLDTDLKTNPRTYLIGSSAEDIEQALQLCNQYSTACEREWYEDEMETEVTLAPFELDKSEVTVGQFGDYAQAQNIVTLAEENGFSFTVDTTKEFAVVRSQGVNWNSGFDTLAEPENQPAVHLSRADAQGYCQSMGRRLPTEAEWEYVARGIERYKYPWGDTWDASKLNWGGNMEDMLPANSFPANERGYFDLAGSVTEWTSTDSIEVNTGILKGGSRFDKNVANFRLPVKRLEYLDYTGEDVGFRCAKSVDEWPTELLP